MWLVLELVVLYVQFGRDLDNAEDIVLSEVGLGLALLMATPRDLLLVGFVVPVLVHLLQRRKSPLKQLFNAANRTLELGRALAVYVLVRPEDPLSAVGWAALALAVIASGTASGLAVSLVISLVISLAIGRVPVRDFAWSVASPVPISLACASAAFVAAVALNAEARGALPALVATFLALMVLVRTVSLLTERHLNLRSLHAFGARLDATRDPVEIVDTALDAAVDLLVAREAEMYLADPADPAGPSGSHGPRRASSRTARSRQAGSYLETSRLIAQLRHEALHDPLTGLPNRTRLLAATRSVLPPQGGGAVLVWLGLDGLATVNAALGHDLGDELLVQVGRRLARHSPTGGLVARVGSEEFAVLLPADRQRPDVDPDRPDGTAEEQAQRLVDALREPFVLFDVEVLVRARAGLAEVTGDVVLTAEELLRRADVAMRQARTTGLDVEEHTPLLETATPATLALAAELRSAIERDELVLHAQPQLRLDGGEVTGVEMLVRWQHPRLGLLPPSAFLPLAEQTGLDRPLTLWVLGRALSALALWRGEGIDLRVSVTVAPTTLADHELPRHVRRLLTGHGLPGDALVLEITESSLIASPTHAQHLLEELAALGVGIAIDDFGTGFSSLSYLRRLPVDEIKVDKSFVLRMLEAEDDAAIVRSVVALGRSLGLRVVAEGIESQEVRDALVALGCEAAQGFHLARPMPLAEVPGWLRSRLVGRLSRD